MNWLNIPIASLRKPEFTACDLCDLGTWLRLTCYCAAQENGGRIRDSRKWTDRQWLIACGVTVADVDRDCPLWTWHASCLVVSLYPVAKEREVAAKRAAGKATAGMRWPRKVVTFTPPERRNHEGKNSSATSSANSSVSSSVHAEGEAEAERKGKERA